MRSGPAPSFRASLLADSARIRRNPAYSCPTVLTFTAVMKSRLGMPAATAALAEYLSGNRLVVSTLGSYA